MMKPAQQQIPSRAPAVAAVAPPQDARLKYPWRLTALLTLTLALCLQPSTPLSAASVGTAFTYQGRLQHNDQPANGSFDFVFRLYDAPILGNPIGSSVTTNALPVQDGLFVVQLDFGPEIFTGDDRWLQINVQTNGGMRYQALSPRQLLTPAPYAQFAGRAASASAASSASYAATAGGVAGSNLMASADGTLTLRAPSIAVESERFTNNVTGNASQVVGLNSELVVGAHLSVNAGGNYQQTIGGDVTQTLGKDLITDVGQNHALSVGGNFVLGVNKALTATFAETAAVHVGTDFSLQARDEVWLKTGQSSMLMKKNGDITIQGKNVNIKGSGEITVKQGVAFRSAATETNETVIGILGESSATNGIGVLGIATSTADEDVHAGVVAVADAGNKRMALFASCVTNDLLPATAVPRPAAIAGYALANQDILQGYGKSQGLKFRVSDGGLVTATAFAGDGAGLTGIGTAALADNSVTTAKIMDGSVVNADLANNSVTSAKIADGTLTMADLSPALASNTFWRLGGNAGTAPGTHFLGTTDDQALEVRVNNIRALRVQPRTGGTPNLAGGHPLNSITADSTGSAIGGGGNKFEPNTITANTAVIGGGRGNAIEGDDSAILGGANNVIQTLSSQSVIGGGEHNLIEHDSLRATIGGGSLNCIHTFGSDSTISGGTGHTNFAFNATIGGGSWNRTEVDAQQATIAGGMDNAIGSFGGTIGGGHWNRIGSGARAATIGGGQSNSCAGITATVGGGFRNSASGEQATVPGGFQCSATAKGSFAAGWRGKAIHEGAFVLADRNDNDLYSDDVNQFTGRFTGGVRFWSSLVGGVRLLPGATSWSILSDRNLKENLQPVDGQDVLRRLTALPLHTWNLTTQDPAIRHLGPMAQDFAAAFQLGETNTCINTVDADGVALAAIQGLNQKVESGKLIAESQIRELKAENAELKRELAELKHLVGQLIK